MKFVIPQIILEEEVAKQVKMAKRDDFYIKKELLLSENLTGEALIAICEDAEAYFNLKGEMVQEWFIHAIDNTELTSKQRLELVTIQEIQPILLMTSSLSSEELIVIAENMNPDLEKSQYYELWYNALNRMTFTQRQKDRISQIEFISEIIKNR